MRAEDVSLRVLVLGWVAVWIIGAPVPSCLADPVDARRAAGAASGWYELRFTEPRHQQAVKGEAIPAFTEPDARPLLIKGTTIAYAFDTAEGGCIAIVADDELAPVFYYSMDSRLDLPGVPAARAIMEALAKTLAETCRARERPTATPHPMWAVLAEWAKVGQGFIPLAPSLPGPVGPLLTTKWNQREPYWDRCPAYQGDRCLVGCAATAMAQIMQYWKHPKTGVGSHSYPWALGGTTLSADFGSTTYDWANMPDVATPSSPQPVKDAVSTLSYHCGVSMEMQYAPDGSVPSTDAEAFADHFGYKYARHVQRSDYSAAQWYDLMRNQIDVGQPAAYTIAYGEEGHRVVLDGHDQPNLLHLNLGWGGQQDGWYAMDGFPGVQGPDYSAILDIRPHREPTACYVNGSTGEDTWDGTAPVWLAGRQGPKKTIQAGIHVTGPQDSVVVADGIYAGPGNRDVDFGGRLIRLRSANGPANCIIDCEGAGRGFYFHSGESELATLDGLTIQNGRADYGGAIYCWQSSPSILNCVIVRNEADQVGGGVYRCGGLLENCVITGNTAQWGGGLALCIGPIAGCAVLGNEAVQVGGGLYKCNGVISQAVVKQNSAEWGGGLAYCDGTLRTCLVEANAASEVGGGLYECNGAIENCTISDNSAKWGGGLGYCVGTIRNSIIWANTAPYGPQLYECSDPAYSCIQGIQAPGPGNISLNPLFASGGYRLGPASPCIDAGDNSALSPPGLDLDDNLRIALGKVSLSVDMGAYEYSSRPFATVEIAFEQNMAKVSWNSQPNDQYRVWSCVDLASGTWTEEANVPAQGAATSWTDGRALGALKFYRVEMR